FFFQAEDGIRDFHVTGVQTCALPICRDFSDIVGPNQQSKAEEWAQGFILRASSGYTAGTVGVGVDLLGQLGIKLDSGGGRINTEIGRASCRGRVEVAARVAG